MSAPVSHDPLVVNTRDGVCWERRAVTPDGRGLYAVEGSCKCPEFVMATLAELAEHGIVGSADVLPVPQGPEPRSELALPWAHAMSDHDLHGFLDDLVSAAMGRWRSEPEVPDRTVLADVEKVCAAWWTPGVGRRLDGSEFDGVTVRLAPSQAPREAEAAPVTLCTDCAHCGHTLNWHGRSGCSAGSAPARCGCLDFTARPGGGSRG